jgi:hypothetical protein
MWNQASNRVLAAVAGSSLGAMAASAVPATVIGASSCLQQVAAYSSAKQGFTATLFPGDGGCLAQNAVSVPGICLFQ